MAAELNDAGITTSTGRRWSGDQLRDVLIRPRNAAIVAHGVPGKRKTPGRGRPYDFEEVGKAAWPPIVPEESWRAVVALLRDPARRTTTRTETRWLGSYIYRCGVEGCGSILRLAVVGKKGQGAPQGAAGRHRAPLYRCKDGNGHLTIMQAPVDRYVRAYVAERLTDPRVVRGLTPGADARVSADRERRAVLAARLEQTKRDYDEDFIDGPRYKAKTGKLREEMNQIDQRMTASLTTFAAASVAKATDPSEAFLNAPLDVQRSVLRALVDVVVMPAGPGRQSEEKLISRLVLSPVGEAADVA